ncbi:protein phosphatase 2C domain-containing protein [Actinacidiphila oryziradicis]|uniref:Protein phosphatase 2C domain-containing protein n=1 Tax=Actinacidiphila oryziradicis TaxID=2571141 RepID=A0A4U0S551_9ACTN|nr:protein phosphatase 2C domain-containing protein [Actinacidiphila oryziradicis]TKA02191.1 protein phosphatase 2C domain-containing protein [Actinacidiphila oryziradicis]
MSRDDSRRDGLMDGRLRAVLFVAVVIGAFIEVSTPHRRYGPLVDVFALAAVGVVGAAAVLGSESAATLARQRDRLAQEPQPSTTVPICRYVTGPAAPQSQPPRPRPFLRERPTDLSVPRFGDGARAQGYPWLLPERTVQNGIAADEATVGAFTIRAASVIGPGHRCGQPAEPRQDSYRIGRSRDSRYAIVAVADGLSSAAWSDAGATTASSQAVTLLREQIEAVGFGGLDVKELYGRIAESIAAHAAGRGVGTSHVATVLITAVLAEPDINGVAEAWVAWLGDSSAWTLDLRGPLWRFCAGEAKDRAAAVVSNEVAGRLPDTPQLARGHYVTLAPGAALALVTDGIGDAWAEPAGNVNEYFANAWRSPVPATRFTADVGFDAPQCLDDRTAVVVWNGGRA